MKNPNGGAFHMPPTFIVGDSGGVADGTAIMVMSNDIRSKFF